MARGSRFPSGVSLSGGYPVGFTSQNYKISGGTVAWAGSALSITHGMTTLHNISVTRYMASAVSVGEVVITEPSVVSGKVSATLNFLTAAGAVSVATSGGTLYWLAFGV